MAKEDAYSPDGRWSRRTVLKTGGAAAMFGGLAGCIGASEDPGGSGGNGGGSGGSGGEIHVVGSFYNFVASARKVAQGTPITVENLVPVGLHGHGWEPGFDVTREIIEADAFVHVGPEFQPWADRAIQVARDDNAGTLMINSRKGVDLIPINESIEDDAIEGSKDPHFWMDPTRMTTAVENIRDEFVELDPDNEAAYTQNAEELKQNLMGVDEMFMEALSDAPKDAAVLVGHNAFQYFAKRYDVTLSPIVYNLAASGQVKASDITRSKELIEEYESEYILHAVLEKDQAAQQLVAETQVEGTLPATVLAGVVPDWIERGWANIEIWKNVNYPSMKGVFGRPIDDEAIWQPRG